MRKRSLAEQADPRASHAGVQPPKPPLQQWRVVKPLVDAPQTVDVLPGSWRRTAMLLALLAATVAVVATLDRQADVATMARLACYIALADDLRPLMESGLRDVAVGSAECEEALASTKASAHFVLHRLTGTGASRVGKD
jgi:hypothetical protein